MVERESRFHLVIDEDILHDVKSRVFLSYQKGVPSIESNGLRIFFTDDFTKYDAFSEDFGPMSVLSIIQFVEHLDEAISVSASACLVCCQKRFNRRGLTNTAFLIGAYMILKLDHEPSRVWNVFKDIEHLFESYCDIANVSPRFELRLVDCWNGLKRGVAMGWIAAPSTICLGWARWGRIYKDEYAHFDNVLNGDLNEVVPGKFIAFKSPRNLGGHKHLIDKSTGLRDFSADYYADVFRVLGVTTVVQLGNEAYDTAPFSQSGLKHVHLVMDDFVPPSSDAIAEFLKAADEAEGLVAVHCGAGRGRTGTLIALYMMRTHGFAAREAIGWLRIMRPGCVIGHQQHFLCAIEDAARDIVRLGLPTVGVASNSLSAESALAGAPSATADRHGDVSARAQSPATARPTSDAFRPDGRGTAPGPASHGDRDDHDITSESAAAAEPGRVSGPPARRGCLRTGPRRTSSAPEVRISLACADNLKPPVVTASASSLSFSAGRPGPGGR